jgi:hypothetical protein
MDQRLLDKAARWHTTAARAVLKVGDGRGFVIEVPAPQGAPHKQRVVVTAAHCLPYMPPAHMASGWNERTYRRLIGPLGGELIATAECLFADPVRDVAVLGPPDTDYMSDFVAACAVDLNMFDPPVKPDEVAAAHAYLQEAAACEQLIATATTLPIAYPVVEKARAWVLSLDGEWVARTVQCFPGSGVLSATLRRGERHNVDSGMSGTPILNDNGKAIGVCSTGSWDVDLTASLPGRFLRRPRKHVG